MHFFQKRTSWVRRVRETTLLRYPSYKTFFISRFITPAIRKEYTASRRFKKKLCCSLPHAGIPTFIAHSVIASQTFSMCVHSFHCTLFSTVYALSSVLHEKSCAVRVCAPFTVQYTHLVLCSMRSRVQYECALPSLYSIRT